MTFRSFFAANCIAFAALAPAACNKQQVAPPNEGIGHHVTRLSIRVGGTWIGGYSVDVAPEEYVVVEHANCPDGKEERPIHESTRGLCVLRLAKEKSDRFEAAMERFKSSAVPLETYSVNGPDVRPDGKPCRNKATDAAWISLQWAGTEGAKIATFDTGCVSEEFEEFYKSVLAVTDPLPIQQIIDKR
ncbi:MAG: hypothetical protein ACR2FK_04000 [Sphingomicrobium sp.]